MSSCVPPRDIPVVQQVHPAGTLCPVHHGEGGPHRTVSIENQEAKAAGAEPGLHPAERHGNLPA